MELTGTELVIRIAGSAALLLWGTRMIKTGMTRSFGREIRRLLSTGTKSPLQAFYLGVASASAVQSSTAVALLTASFASTSVVTVAIGLAIVLGADLGSAIIAQLLALNIWGIWPALIFVGYVLHSVFELRNAKIKQIGRMFLGLGFIFLSLVTLSQAAAVIKESEVIHHILSALGNEPALAILVAALLTWLAHSSLATLLMFAVLASGGVFGDGFLPYFLVLGVNAGAALPALTMGMSEPPAGRRVVVGNFLFRLVGMIGAAATISLWGPIVASADLALGQKLIFLHIFLNILLVCVFLNLTGVAEKLLARLIPDLKSGEDEQAPRYLDAKALEVPDVALTLAARETLRMVDIVEQMLGHAMEAIKDDNDKVCAAAKSLDDVVDSLYTGIKLYLTDLTRSELDDRESARAMDIIMFATNLEDAGDVIDRSLIDTVRKKIRGGHSFSDDGYSELLDAYDYVASTIVLSSSVFMERGIKGARELIARKERFREIEQGSLDGHLSRLRSGQPQTVATTSYHIDILRDLKRVNSLFVSVAYPILDAAGGLRGTRLQ